MSWSTLKALHVPIRPAWTDEEEWLDAPTLGERELADNLAELRQVNRWLGGVWLTLRGLERLTRELNRGAEITIADLATGGGDIPHAVERWAARRGFRARIVATDLNPRSLRLIPCRPGAALERVAADACFLPLPDRSFDIAICSLALHHFRPELAVTVLREMRRVSRRGVVVNDLVRSWLGYGGAWLIGRTLSRNPIFRHDSVLSVRRSYTRSELAALAGRAGLGKVVFDGFLGYRVAMTAGAHL